MFKKVLIGTSVAAVLGGLVLGRDSWSYVSTSVSSVRKAIKQEVPIEFEVQRARDLVAQVDGEIKKCLHVIAEEEVNVDDLQRSFDQQVGSHVRQKEQILAQRHDLEQKRDTYSYGGRIYTVSEVERDLADRFSRYQTVEETIQNRRTVLTARQQSLKAARQKLDNMLDSKEQLLAEIENLDARLKTLQASEAATTVVSIDDSHLAHTRHLVAQLNKQIEVRQKLADSTGSTDGLIPMEKIPEAGPSVAVQIDKYFGTQAETKPAAESPVPSTAAL